uniref:phospholipase D family nuclease n=1 Tax=Burkholderia arboris TaxID=488730 RepID=UPI003BEF2264
MKSTGDMSTAVNPVGSQWINDLKTITEFTRPLRRRFGVVAVILCALAAPAYASTVCNVDVGYSPEGSAEQLAVTAIASARSSIRVAAYTFSSPVIAHELVSARRRGVDVAVLVDQKESRSKSQQAALNLLVSSGVRTRTVSAYPIHHDKFLVIDGSAVETGSLNYSSAAMRRNSENAVLLTGCPDLARSYLTHWMSRWDQGVDYSPSY